MILHGIAEGIGKVIEFIGRGFNVLLDFFAQPIMFLLTLLEGIFYFITVLFNIVVKIIQIFVALFQLFFAVATGLVSSFDLDASFNPGDVGSINLPYYSSQGFQAVMDHLIGTGLMTVIPYALTALLYLAFARKVMGLLGGSKD